MQRTVIWSLSIPYVLAMWRCWFQELISLVSRCRNDFGNNIETPIHDRIHQHYWEKKRSISILGMRKGFYLRVYHKYTKIRVKNLLVMCYVICLLGFALSMSLTVSWKGEISLSTWVVLAFTAQPNLQFCFSLDFPLISC